jgi:hypothetical protein
MSQSNYERKIDRLLAHTEKVLKESKKKLKAFKAAYEAGVKSNKGE